MIKKSIIVLLVVITTKLATANAVTINQVDISPRVKTISEIIDEKALQYGVSAEKMRQVINCESSFNTNAKNITSREQSYGLVQINRLAHPHITIEQATSPEFAINFLAENMSKGKGGMWSCF